MRSTPKRTGRRPGPTTTREAILRAAARQFAAHGYDRASLRRIAGEAGVDQKLIAHYFGSKQQLFVAAIGLPLDPGTVLPVVLEREDGTLADRLADAIVAVLEQPEIHERVTGVIRGAATHPEMARMLREFLTRAVFEPIASSLDTDRPLLRANLVGSQIVGLLMARSVVGVEPLASLPARTLAEAVAPTLERYLVGPLTASDS
ncbi:MAG TPA: TetR family transcriptional regulator [Gaiellaceae bacterium]|nr:TetR family transcriptional regulator [Gaiellaceae bacterium]